MMSRANMGKQIMTAPAKKMASGGMAFGGGTKKMAKGGMTRGDGCCSKGKTKGKMC